MRFAKLDAEGEGGGRRRGEKLNQPKPAMVTTVAYTCFSNVVLKRFVS